MSKVFIALFSVFFSFIQVKAQTAPPIQLSSLYGSTKGDVGLGIIQTTDNGFLIYGHAGSNTGQVSGILDSNQAFSDFWVIKINQSGHLLWAKALPGSSKAAPIKMIESSSSYVLIGSSVGKAGIFISTPTSPIQQSAWLIFLDKSTGALTGPIYPGGTNYTEFSDIAEVSRGKGYIALGIKRGATSGQDLWLVRLSPGGAPIWEKIYSSSGVDRNGHFSLGKDHTILISAQSTGNDGFLAGKACPSGACQVILKTDTLGNKLSLETFDFAKYFYADFIWHTDGGDYMLAAALGSGGGTVPIHPPTSAGYKGKSDFFLWKVSKATGKELWSRCYGGSDDDYLQMALKTDDNGAVLFGGTHSSDGDVGAHIAYSNMWMVRTDSNGNILWKKTFGNNSTLYGGQFFGSMTLTCDNSYAFVSDAKDTGADVQGSYHGGEGDIWFCKLAPEQALTTHRCLNIDPPEQINTMHGFQFSIFPNPAMDQLSLENAPGATLKIFNSWGRLVQIDKISSERQQINISELPPGAYMLQVTDTQGNRGNKVFLKQ